MTRNYPRAARGATPPRGLLLLSLLMLAGSLYGARPLTAAPASESLCEASPPADLASPPDLASAYLLSIAYLREQAYPGSDLIIEQKLAPGSNYDRYIASYLSEGLKQYGLLTIPRGTRPPTGWPVIVFNHGYIPPQEYRTTERYVAYVDAFARAGYIVFRPDYRGHDRSEGSAPGPYASPAYTVDVLNAVASLKHYPAADAERIGMWGHSMGGWITLRAMVTTDDIKAGVIWSGVVGAYEDLITGWKHGVASTGRDAAVYGVTNPTNPAMWTAHPPAGSDVSLWAALSANYCLTELSGPLQLHHAEGDAVVPVEFSELLYRQAQAAGMPVELHTYRGDNHNITANFDQAMTRSIAFFDRWLKQPANIKEDRGPRVYSGGGTVNLREGPGTNSSVVGQMGPGESLPIVGRSADGRWWLVAATGGRAWVAADVTIAAHTAGVPVVGGKTG